MCFVSQQRGNRLWGKRLVFVHVLFHQSKSLRVTFCHFRGSRRNKPLQDDNSPPHLFPRSEAINRCS